MPNVIHVIDTRKKPAPGPGPGPEPSTIAPYTLRFQFSVTGEEPQSEGNQSNVGTWTEVDASQGIWDWTYENEDWSYAFDECFSLPSEGESTWRVIGAGDTSGVTTMDSLFNRTGLAGVVSFDTSNVTNIDYMFANCNLDAIPAFDFSSVTACSYTFAYNADVASGITEAYAALSALDPEPTHNYTFYGCGSESETGAAELAEVPDDWKGVDP